MWLLTAMVTALVLASGVAVHNSGDCPSGEAIVARLGPLLSAGGGQDDVAWVDTAARSPDGTTELHLRLQRSDGSLVGDRRLVLRGGCEEMADTVATVLAAWTAPPVPAGVQSEATAPRAAPVLDAAAAKKQAWLGAGGGMAWVGGLAATANLELVVGRAAARARVAAITQTSRQLDLDPGTVSWRRSHAELGLGWQSRGAASTATWQASADAGVLLGWLRASGHGFNKDTGQDAFEYGVGAGLRGERRLGAWALWLEGRGNLWARPQRAVLSGSPASALLPRFDVLVTLGASRLLVR